MHYPDGKLNFKVIIWILVGAVMVGGIYFVVSTTLDLALRAGVNIGIVTTIWAINPFTSALMDWIIYGIALSFHHWFGMLGLIVCAVLISLSSVFKDNVVET